MPEELTTAEMEQSYRAEWASRAREIAKTAPLSAQENWIGLSSYLEGNDRKNHAAALVMLEKGTEVNRAQQELISELLDTGQFEDNRRLLENKKIKLDNQGHMVSTLQESIRGKAGPLIGLYEMGAAELDNMGLLRFR